MPDEPTLGEVVRRLEAVHADLKEDLREYGARLDGKVSMERYQLEQHAGQESLRLLVERVTAIEEARATDARQAEADRRAADDRRRSDRRLVFSALVAPVLMLLLQLYLSSRGAGV